MKDGNTDGKKEKVDDEAAVRGKFSPVLSSAAIGIIIVAIILGIDEAIGERPSVLALGVFCTLWMCMCQLIRISENTEIAVRQNKRLLELFEDKEADTDERTG